MTIENSRTPSGGVVVIGSLSQATRERLVKAADGKIAKISDAPLTHVVEKTGVNLRKFSERINKVVGTEGVVAPIRVFDLDHLGAKIGQSLRAGGTGNDAGKVDNQQTIKGSRFALCARRSLGQLRSCGHFGHFLLLFCMAKLAASAAETASRPFSGSPQITPNPDFAGRELPLT